MSTPTFQLLVERMANPRPAGCHSDRRSSSDQLGELVAVVRSGIEEALQHVERGNDEPAGPAPLMDVKDVAEYLNVSERFVEGLVAAGDLTPIRIRSLRRFTQEAVDAYLRHCAGSKRRRR